jgi:16S rRNA (cytosine1402-N4)-methyltransferase
MVREVVALLRDAKTVLDGTLGGGGHTAALLDAGVPRVIGVDRDPDALAAARERLADALRDGRFSSVHSNYADAAEAPELNGLHPDAVLLDLGVSSHQLDDASRGFTFRPGAPLDMRMGPEPRTAADVLNEDDEDDLARVFRDYGDEPRAGRLAREVVRRRAREPFATSDHFVNAIRGALGPKSGPSDFARLFQAVRIAVNDEIAGLGRALSSWRDALAPGGLLAVITYHSGEDRLVKHTFREWSADCVCPPKQMQCTCRGRALGGLVTRKAVPPSAEEQRANPRARSARLRAWRKATEGA